MKFILLGAILFAPAEPARKRCILPPLRTIERCFVDLTKVPDGTFKTFCLKLSECMP